MIYCFDDFQLKHLCDVIEAERRVRERLYNELTWTNAWSPGGMTRGRRPRSGKSQKQTLKKRPSSARKYDERYESDTSRDEGTLVKDRPSSARLPREKIKEVSKRKPKSHALEYGSEASYEESLRLKKRPQSAREAREKVKEDVRRKPRTLAFEIGSESKSVAVKWGTDPRNLSVTMGDGYGRKARQQRKPEPEHDRFVISNFGKGSSFQVNTGRTTKDPTNITIDNVRRGTSGPKETLRVTGGGTNVVIHNPKRTGLPNKGSNTIHVASGDTDVVVHKPQNEDSDSSQSNIIRKERKPKKSQKRIKDTSRNAFENNNAITFSEETGTQTAWMDTDPDPAPTSGSCPPSRRIKFMGEDRTHREYKTAFIDDQKLVRPMTDDDIPLVVEVVQPDEDDEEYVDEKSVQENDRRPEVIHYIDKTVPARAIEPFEPVFVMPHPAWEPESRDKRPHTPGRVKSRPPLPPRQYRPLDVYDRRSADTNDRFLVVKTRAPPRKPPRPTINYHQHDDAVFSVY
ncbi:uncharacterized protein LOC110452338 [Mizuhopecten yessoensis]|uniref:Uncharacterized protein n=1 Tax=Mizuhopecten yessoensis TaxID=6573 RepID=A0A210QJP4_MIZYE|nr:uncharacterized protein LOC110452338 [Mizuhopecten yessoensis]OWF48987.1 hypothetical protein KP79_PYT06976 [Mizuhopecten yessoensis]